MTATLFLDATKRLLISTVFVSRLFPTRHHLHNF